ncbi:MAG: hypothetical protein IPJ89_02795 [Candidatus Iainarchaeum archaeon]|uniref:dolichyl-phosphooligosaccharide-protein glycotransferase n=1 Tax=Candidatus Iainarchaeum sp. TaxID=3101447 RepID=A0A7T9I2K5_9ARCH|nr:MAG: hypothetical protein IPJ89_02795 [Candidatus Diapherotrites archaeon]
MEALAASNDVKANLLSGIGKFFADHQWKLIALVFLLAFIVRAHLMRYELFFEFDSYWHARMVAEVLQNGLPTPAFDSLTYYHNVSAATLTNAPALFWIISATIYKIFTLNAPYQFDLWVLFVKILPALYGALISVATYFLGRELFKGQPYEKAAGFFAGILAAIVPAFVYRTMGGFFEDDSLGFIWMIIGFIFLVRTMHHPSWNRDNLVNALLAGIAFALMAFTWPAFNMLVPILLGVGVVHFFLYLGNNELEKTKHYAGLWGISFALLAIAATIQTNLFWLDQFGGILASIFRIPELNAVNTVGFIALVFVLCAAAWVLRKRQIVDANALQWVFRLLILGLVLMPFVIYLFDINLQQGGGSQVGEESVGKTYFGNKYSMLALFAVIGIPLMGFLLWRKKNYHVLALPLVWIVVTFFMAWGKLKFTYYWGLPLAVVGAIVLILAIRWALSRKLLTQKIVVFLAAFMLMCGIAAGTLFVTQNVPNIESSAGWKEALFWSEKNLPVNAKFFNWWDEGHWISFLSQRKVLIDNRNADFVASGKVALFMLTEDANTARSIIDEYGSTHIIFGDDLLSKQANLAFYAYSITNGNDPRVQGIFGTTLQCQSRIAPLTKEQTYSCGSNSFTPAQMSAFPTTYTTQPNQLQDGAPLYIYREADNSKIYAFSQKANKTQLVRLWMNDPELANEYELIYKNYGGVRIWEVLN